MQSSVKVLTIKPGKVCIKSLSFDFEIIETARINSVFGLLKNNIDEAHKLFPLLQPNEQMFQAIAASKKRVSNVMKLV